MGAAAKERVTSLINIDLSVELVYDKDVTDDLQVKQILAIGIAFAVL